MNVDQSVCPLCKSFNVTYGGESTSDVHSWRCRRCGIVQMTYELLTFFEAVRPKLGPTLSILTRISTDTGSPTVLTHTNYETLAKDLPRYTPMEKLDILLQRLMLTTESFGKNAEFSEEWDYPVTFCVDYSE